MNLDELQSVRDRERRTDRLQELRERFYADAGEFIQGLREERDRVADRVDDPFDSPEVNRLTDEIDTAEQTVEAIYEKRVGKIVKAASIAAADLPAGSEGMTAEEQELFDALVADIESNREHVLDVLAGEAGDTPEPGPTDADGPGDAATDEPTGASMDAAEVMGGADTDAGESGRERSPPDPPARGDGAGTRPGDPPETGSGSAGESGADTAEGGHERETVRITADVGTILGVDQREYDLSKDDVVRLPATNASPLVERDAAERLD